MTKTDARRGNDWLIDDAVSRLRVSGTERAWEVRDGATIGNGPPCAIVLDDPRDLVSREHATIFREAGHWALEDLGSKNGLRMDGVKRPKFPLVPGLEIGVGGLVLVAESPKSIELRGFVQRLLGWDAACLGAVDRALQAIRMAASHRGILPIHGEGELISIVHAIHRKTFASGPFVECNPKRKEAAASVRAPQNIPDVDEAFRAAHAGTLCFWSEARPKRVKALVESHRTPGSRVQLVVLSHKSLDPAFANAIEVPMLASRSEADRVRVIDEYGADAVRELRTIIELEGLTPTFLSADRDWIRDHVDADFGEIEKAALRLVALRATEGTAAVAARMLGMSNVALIQWRGTRRLPRYDH